VHHNNRAGSRGHAPFKLRRVDIVRIGMNVSEDRRSAQRAYGTAGRDKGERRQNDLIAGVARRRHAAPVSAQSVPEPTAHAMVHAAELCDFRFQCGAFAAQNKLLATPERVSTASRISPPMAADCADKSS